MFRRIQTAVACSLLLLALLAPPAFAEPEEATTQNEDTAGSSELAVLAESQGMGGSTVEVNTLERAGTGETSLLWTFRNLAGERVHATAFRVPKYLNYYSTNATHGVTLLDESSQTRYYPLVDSDQRCLCTGGFRGPGYTTFVDPDRKSTYWNTYLLPEDVTTVTVEFPDFEPIEDVPIS